MLDDISGQKFQRVKQPSCMGGGFCNSRFFDSLSHHLSPFTLGVWVRQIAVEQSLIAITSGLLVMR